MGGVQWQSSPEEMLCRWKQVGGWHVQVSCQAERMPTSAEETKNPDVMGRAESDACKIRDDDKIGLEGVVVKDDE